MSSNYRSSGNRNRKKQRYRVRYDRLIAVGVVFIVLIVILVSCIGSCSDKDKKGAESSNSQGTVIDNTTPSGSASTPQSGNNTPDSTQPATAPVDTTWTTISVDYSEINKGDLVLVNKTYEYKFTEELSIVDVFSNLNEYYTVSDGAVLLEANTIYYLNMMMEAYYNGTSGNTDLRVIGGHRSKDMQTDKFENNTTDIAGGYSDYHTARSLDIATFPTDGSSSYYLIKDGVYSWVFENASKYGFIQRYPEGKDNITGVEARSYTFRYVGIPHAIHISQNNLSLEEYIDTVKTYTKDAPLKITDGVKNYEVYYVMANANNITEVTVPSNKTYTISGNNVDGFIVTVSLS